LSRLFCQDRDQDQDSGSQDQDQDQDFIFCPRGASRPRLTVQVSSATSDLFFIQ